MAATINYRYPTEYRNLAITLVLVVIILVLTATVSFGTLMIIILAAIVLNYLVIRTQIEGLKRSAVQVTAEQYPEIFQVVQKNLQYVKVPVNTRVYVVFDPVLNAYAIGMGVPYAIVLHSALVEALDAEELSNVIGHEMGHILFGHTTLLTFIGVLGNQTLGIPMVGDIIRFAFLFWSRSAEFTSDRAGLVAGGRLDKAVSTEIKLAVGPDLARKINMEALQKQGEATHGNIFSELGEMQSTHPMLTSRLQKLREFAFSETYRLLRPDARLEETSQAPARPGSLFSPAAGKSCLRCGRVTVDASAMFCIYCGARLNSRERKCPACQYGVDADWKVCPKCGTVLM